jgi:LPXTG-motif cell wall-anchored protein
METAVGMPPAIQTWWYPGERIGYQFVYPKGQARLLAKGTGQPVLTTVTETPVAEAPTPDVELALISPTGEEKKVPVATPSPAAPSGPMQVGELAPPALAIPAQARATLPKTATAMPLIGFAGLAFLLTAALLGGVGFVRRRQK